MSAFDVIALRSVDLGVPNLATAASFYTDVWGLTAVQIDPATIVLRATGADHHVLVLHLAATPVLLSMTFRVAHLAVLTTIETRTRDAGGHILEPIGVKDWPAGGTGLVIADPAGCVMRFVHADARRTADPAVLDRPERLSHVNINSQNVDATAKFFETVLGFKLSDRSKLMAFVRTNADHHTIVIAQAPVDGLNHVAFLLPGLEGVLLGAGRMIDHGYPIGWGVGRHGPGNNVFAYFVDPSGIVIEYTADVLQVDDHYQIRGPADWVWPPGRSDLWGIAPPKSDAVKAAQIAIGFAPKDPAT